MFKRRKPIIIGIVVLLLAIPLSLYLIRQQQILKGRAQEGLSITFPGLFGNPPTTQSQNVQLRLTYGQFPGAPPTPPPPPPPPVAGGNQCSFNLADGQILGGSADIVLTGQRSDPLYYLSLQIVASRQGSFQAISSQTNTLFANISTTSLFQNGPATLECRIQTDHQGGTILYSNTININIQN